jgi:hypothetical protein
MLSLVIWRAKRRIRKAARRYCRDAKVFSFGAIDINPDNLAIWITTATDDERNVMRASPEFLSELREIRLAAGYPRAAIPEVGFEFESQQTVDRDYGGNWWYRIK